MTEPTGTNESILSALLRDRAQAIDGSLNAYANRIGIAGSTLGRWIQGQNTPSRSLFDKLAKETGMSPEALERLGETTIEQACELVLRDDPVEQELSKRFTGLVQERGESIPAAAYAVFITGDTGNRAALVNILENNPDGIPGDFTSETLRFALDLPNSGLLSKD